MESNSNRPNLTELFFAGSVYLFVLSLSISIVAAQAAAAMILTGAIILALSRRESSGISSLMTYSIISFLVLVLISALLSSHFNDAVPQLRKSWVMLCFIPIVAYSSAFSRFKAVEFLIIGTAAGSAVALFRFFFGGLDRAAPYSGGYTTLAICIAAVLPLAIWRYSQVKWPRKWIYLAFITLMAAGLIFSKTRAGWLAALVSVMIMGFSMNLKRSIIGLSLFVILIAAIPQTRNIIIDRFVANKKGGVTSGRLILYKSAAEPLSGLPFFGYGPGSFGRLVPARTLQEIGDPGIKSWHSTPLEVLIESGPVSLLVLMLIAFLPFRYGLIRRREFPDKGLFYSAILASMTGLYLAGLSTNLLRDFMILSLMVFLWSIPFSGGQAKDTEIKV